MDGLSFYFGVAVGAVVVNIAWYLWSEMRNDDQVTKDCVAAIDLGRREIEHLRQTIEAQDVELAVTRASLKRYTRKRNKQGRFSK